MFVKFKFHSLYYYKFTPMQVYVNMQSTIYTVSYFISFVPNIKNSKAICIKTKGNLINGGLNSYTEFFHLFR